MSSRNPFLKPKDRPLVTGHRGVPLLAQENTVAGLRRAVELGVPAVEIDVMVTRDDKVVLFHDEDTERLTGEPGALIERTWDQLSRLRIRRRLSVGKAADGGERWVEYAAEERIPLLAEVLDEFKGKLAINIELKPAMPSWARRAHGAVVAEVIRAARAEDSVIATSFDLFKLRALESAHARLHSGLAYDDNALEGLLAWTRWLPELEREVTRAEGNQNVEAVVNELLEANTVGRWIGSSVAVAEFTLIDSDTVSKLRARGIQAVGAYTLLSLDAASTRGAAPSEDESWAEVDRLSRLGVDWIETDEPERMLERVGVPA